MFMVSAHHDIPIRAFDDDKPESDLNTSPPTDG